MFTGLVEQKATLVARSSEAGGERLVISHAYSGLALGESIAVSGACLTVVAFDEKTFSVQASPETLALTTLGGLHPGSTVNLERALPVGARLGGHLVTGHVDGLGTLESTEAVGEMSKLVVRVPAPLRKYMAKKGSVTVEGVSLTVNEIGEETFSLLIIPHTLKVTTLEALKAGDCVNLEVDLVARYVERLLSESDSAS